MTKRVFLTVVSLAVVGLIIITALGLLWEMGKGSSGGEVINSFNILGSARGFTVTAGEGGDFPRGEAPTVEEMEAQLNEIVAFAAKSGFNTIFFRVSDGGEAFYRSKVLEPSPLITAEDGLFSKFDPLEFLCKAAKAEKLQVLAVVDAFSLSGVSGDPARQEEVGRVADLAGELVKEYGVAGVVLEGLGYDTAEDALTQGLSTVSAAMKSTSPGKIFGLLFDGEASPMVTPDMILALTESGAVDMVIPRLTAAVEDGEGGYPALLGQWLAATGGDARLYTGNLALGSDADEVGYQLFLGTVTEGVSGAVLEGYSQLSRDIDNTEQLVSFLSAGSARDPLAGQNLAYERTLAVTYPEGGFRTTGRSVFIMGTSSPDEPLTVDGQPLERLSFGGTFGYKADLVVGTNTFTFRQGGEAVTVSIVRYTASTTPTPITGLTKSTIYPQVDLGVDVSETITFSCVGPSGGKVTATLNGKTVSLSQVAAATQGTPVAFQGTLALSPGDYRDDITESIGTVTYVLSYQGVNSSYVSVGEVFVAGKNVQLQVRVNTQMTNVLEKVGDDDSVYATLKEYAVVEVFGKEKTTRDGVGTVGYELADGGFILGNNLEIVDGPPVAGATVTAIDTELFEGGEYLYFTQDTPGVIATRGEGYLSLDFFATDIRLEEGALTSGFFDRFEVVSTQHGTRLTLFLGEGADLWGYNIESTGEGIRLYLKRTPTRSTTFGKPLEGITVMVDPGHGGADPGALGITNGRGANEADLNLAVAMVTKYRLEQMGATVVMTRMNDLTADGKFTIVERNLLADEVKPDIFISLHHNSAVLAGDLNEADWMECYYFEEESVPFAEKLLARLGPALGRETDDPAWARFYVTRLTFAPAVLLELGFMVNPVNFEECSHPLTIYKTACGISRSILEMFPAPEVPPAAE